jgi:hypothetical protein
MRESSEDVIPLHRCGRCKKLGNPCDITLVGELVASIIVCDKCLSELTTDLLRVRPVFDSMIACGIDRDLANDTMTYLLERRGINNEKG